MSNTEFFDILDLASSAVEPSGLQRQFCDLMRSRKPSDHHPCVSSWAKRHDFDVITVNFFDKNLSGLINADYFVAKAFTDCYPWSSYFSDEKIGEPRHYFAIWHAHGMMC